MDSHEHDRDVVRDLARRVAEIAALPVQREKRELWTRLNRLGRVRPLIHVQAIDWNIWEELIPNETLLTTDRFCRNQELELRKRIYCWEHLRDDRVVDDVVVCPLAIRGDAESTGFGIKAALHRPEEPSGAYAFVPVIVEESDIDKIRIDPQVSVDWADTERRYDALSELYGGVLRVEKRGPSFFWFQTVDHFIRWRGVEQTFIDMMDRPAWLHEALERITTAYTRSIDQIEALGVLSLSNANTRLGSGGYGWTDQLPQSDFDGTHVRLKDLWARAATQIFTRGISPAMHDEFALQYEKRLLERFGLSCYGCCEPLDNKMHIIRKIRNLRRVSMSPWVDVARAAAEVGRDYVYTHKPNPSIVSMERWHPELAERQLRDAFEKTRNSVVEVNLQDVHTVRNEPHRLTEWTRIAMRLAEEYSGA
jgi:hypothetical protein